ncbi:MAG: IS4 family transposase [Ktedonobacteraceae bacterium]|nr:IS4 family transposase [Ktedonobacteraceae bacterium]
MPLSLRQISQDDKLVQQTLLYVFDHLYPVSLISQILEKTHAWEQRERETNMVQMCYLIMALHLFPRLNQRGVLREMASGVRGIWPRESFQVPVTSAISTRRKQLPVLVMRRLFEEVCHPIATQETKGAFALSLRLMAIDGTLDNVIETAANAAHFGRTSNEKQGSTPFPQVRCAYLSECATHSIVAARMGPCTHSEEALAMGLASSITAGMLVLVDRGLFSLWWAKQIQDRQSHLLARLSSTMLTHPSKILSDGSFLVQTRLPARGMQPGEVLTLRVIEYHIADAVLGESNRIHRLVTTLLDPLQAPAEELIRLYHERWEIELSLDEQKSHLRLASRPLRGQTPELVYQELYGLLLTHFAIRSLMHEAAVQGELDPDRLSFTHAVEVVSRAVRDFAQWSQADHPVLRARLLEDLRDDLLPAHRRLRFQSRAVKRSTAKFDSKRHHFVCYTPDHIHSFEELIVPQRRLLLLN